MASRPRHRTAIFVWCGPIWGYRRDQQFAPGASRWAIIVLSVAALTLGACGRKGPLDPPTSSTNAPLASAPAPTDTEAENAAKPSVFNSTYGTEAAPVAPKGAKKSFVLDPLLGN